MIRKRKIRPREVLNEIRSGISEAELRTKYRLSAKGVERLFNLLVANGTVGQSELLERYPRYERKLAHVEQRWEPRVSLNGKVLYIRCPKVIDRHVARHLGKRIPCGRH